MSEMILTLRVPSLVRRGSFPASDLLEPWLETDRLGEVAAIGVLVIVAALLFSGIVVWVLLALMV